MTVNAENVFGEWVWDSQAETETEAEAAVKPGMKRNHTFIFSCLFNDAFYAAREMQKD